MKSKILVSACLITYNQEKYIEECIKGALSQKIDRYEIIIGDDCSTDRTSEICSKYDELYPNLIKYYRREQNLGMIGNWITTIQNAQGKYIALCEGDDYWTDPLKLQKQVDFLEENEEYVVTSHNAKVINSEGEILKQRQLPKLTSNKEYSQQTLKKGIHLLTLTIVFRNVYFSSIFKEYFVNILNADTYLISCLGFYGKGMYLDNIGDACYRVHEGGVWSKKSEFIKFRNLINTYSSLYNLHNRQCSEDDVLNYFKNLLSKLSDKMISRADKKISFVEFKNSVPIYLKHSNKPSVFTIIKSFLLLIYRKLNLGVLIKRKPNV